MTVAQLIALLQQLPQDALVLTLAEVEGYKSVRRVETLFVVLAQASRTMGEYDDATPADPGSIKAVLL